MTGNPIEESHEKTPETVFQRILNDLGPREYKSPDSKKEEKFRKYKYVIEEQKGSPQRPNQTLLIISLSSHAEIVERYQEKFTGGEVRGGVLKVTNDNIHGTFDNSTATVPDTANSSLLKELKKLKSESAMVNYEFDRYRMEVSIYVRTS